MSVPLRLRIAYPLSFLTGLLYWLAFPGMDVWPLSFVALVPLIVALAGQRPKHGFGLGWLAGFGMTVTGFYFLSYTLQEFSGFPLPLCFLFQAILAAYQAGRIGLFGWLATRGEQRGWGRGLTLALAFAASEQVFPLLFKWFYAATVHQVTPLIQVAELGGPILVSLVVLGVNYALAELVLSRLERRRPRPLALAAAAAPVLAAAYGLIRMPLVDSRSEAAEKVEVGLVQANMSLMGKRKNKREGLDRHLRLTEELKKQGKLDLVVWSETSVMSAVLEDEADKALRQQFTKTLGVPALFGSVLVRPVADAREYALFNSALLTDKKGRVVGRFDKQLLLAFGEYLPFGETFPILYEWSPHSGHFQAGTSFKPLSLGEKQIAVMICYEDLLPHFINRMVSEGEPELLANLTNDAWFGDTTEPWIHLALAKFRAVEQRKFFVRSTNSGVSAFIDPNGRIISNTSTFVETSQRATLRWLKGKTPYALWGDVPWYLVTVASVVLALRKRRRALPGAAADAVAGPEPEPNLPVTSAALPEAAPPLPEPSSPEPPAAPASAPVVSTVGLPAPPDPLPAELQDSPTSAPARPGFPKPGESGQ
ncbi:MAG: apolipoprotein N-acyltransferase [Myxococcales bacterium]|nr:MAG: apolipoprotein N-acyltransferase [Myxococcales bacterium]